MVDWQLNIPLRLLAGWMIITAPNRVVFIFRLDTINRLRGHKEDTVRKPVCLTHVNQTGTSQCLWFVGRFFFVPLDGNVTTGKFWGLDRPLRPLSLLHSPAQPLSLFLTIFSRRWSSLNIQQWRIYQGGFCSLVWSKQLSDMMKNRTHFQNSM